MTTMDALLRNLLLAMRIDANEIRARLKLARKESGLTQEHVAELLRVHKGTIENDEGRSKDEARALWERLNDYARIYNVPMEYLLWGDDVIAQTHLLEDRLATVVHRLEGVVETLAAELARPEESRVRSQGESPPQ